MRNANPETRIILNRSRGSVPPQYGQKRGGDGTRRRRTLRDFRIEFALGVTLGHLGGGENLLELAGLSRGVELLQALLAELGHRLHRRLQIFARIELVLMFSEHFADPAAPRHPGAGVDIDPAADVLDAPLPFRAPT